MGWRVIAQLARLVLEYSERQLVERRERPIVEEVEQSWGIPRCPTSGVESQPEVPR